MLTREQPPERYTPNDGRQQAVALKDSVVIPYEGVRADTMSRGQRQRLVDLIRVYTSHLRSGHDREWLGRRGGSRAHRLALFGVGLALRLMSGGFRAMRGSFIVRA